MIPFFRSALGVFCVVSAGVFFSQPLPASAQNIFNLPAQNENERSSQSADDSGVDIFSGGGASRETTDETTAGGDPSPSPPASDTNLFVRQDQPAQRPTARGSVASPLYRSDVARLERMANADTTMKFLSEMGISPEDYMKRKAAFEKVAAANPQANLVSPYATLDLMTEGKRYTEALSQKIKASCNLPGATVMLDLPSFLGSNAIGKAKETINEKVIQPLGTVIDSICAQRDLREKMATGFYMLKLQHQSGNARGSVSRNDGIYTIAADFSTKDPVSVQAVRAQLVDGINQVAADRERMAREAGEEEAGN